MVRKSTHYKTSAKYFLKIFCPLDIRICLYPGGCPEKERDLSGKPDEAPLSI